MLDLHCHLLPGVDDGASDIRDSLAMAELAADSGVKGIAATPHFGLFSPPQLFQTLPAVFDLLDRELEKAGLPLPIYRGMELYASAGLRDILRKRQIITLNASRFLLTEFDFGSGEIEMDYLLAQIADAGYIPVIAHPERYDAVQRNPELPFRWCEEGWILQLNKGSFFGVFGNEIAETAHRMLYTGTVHLISSDAHSPYHRTTRLSDIHSYISDNCFPALADLLLRENPRMILSDRLPSAANKTFPIHGDY